MASIRYHTLWYLLLNSNGTDDVWVHFKKTITIIWVIRSDRMLLYFGCTRISLLRSFKPWSTAECFWSTFLESLRSFTSWESTDSFLSIRIVQCYFCSRTSLSNFVTRFCTLIRRAYRILLRNIPFNLSRNLRVSFRMSCKSFWDPGVMM